MTNCGSFMAEIFLLFVKKLNKIKLNKIKLEEKKFICVMYFGKCWSSLTCNILLIPNLEMIGVVIITGD